MKCLQIHNDYMIAGGETQSAKLIASVLEENGVEVIRYYKDNKQLENSNLIKKLKAGISSVYNLETKKEIQDIISNNKIDFALIHNTSPMISNSVYEVLIKKNIPILKYVQNYNLLCLNGSMDKNEALCQSCCNKCNFIGVKNKCYKNSFMFTLIKYINKKIFDFKYISKISRFISISQFVKNQHVKNGLLEEKVKVIYHFVDNNQPILNDSKNYYLYMGRLSEEKGIKTLLNAFLRLKDKELYIMGDGPLKEYIISFIEKNSLSNVFLKGYKSGKEKDDIIKGAVCTIVPSEWDEPFGRIVIESYSMGIPVIASDRGGLSELVVQNITGFKFEDGNVDSLIHSILAMSNLTFNKHLYLRNQCLNYSITKFSREAYYKNFYDLLREIDSADNFSY